MRARSWNASALHGGEAHYYRNVGKLYFEEEPARPNVSSWRAVLIAILFNRQTGNYIASRTRHAPTQTRSDNGCVIVGTQNMKGLKKTLDRRNVNIVRKKKMLAMENSYIKSELATVKIDIYVNRF